MAVNDRILVDGIIEDRLTKAIPSGHRDEVFEWFAIEQVLKGFDPSPEDMQAGWVDGRDDGGIDGFYLFVNGHFVTEPKVFIWPRGAAELKLYVISCKHHDTFKQATVDKLVATLSEVLDLAKTDADLSNSYSIALLKRRRGLVQAYKTLGTRIASFSIDIVYASRGDSQSLGDSVLARARQAESVVRDLFSGVNAEARFLGCSELVTLARKTKRYSLELPFVECFSQGERYVLLSRLDDYARFVLDEDKAVRRYLYDSNVRDFVGMNRVNEDIAASLASKDGPDFWWLNNGITILTTKAVITGKSIALDDVQIVNGLQTTESVARFFAAGGSDARQRAILVKLIKTHDPAVRDAIIRATNNQSAVEQQSLHATDKIQRDIEQVLLRAKWYYDRRANYHANMGVPADRIVSPLYVASGAVGLLLRSPSKAAVLKQKFMRSSASYRQVFSERVDLGAWPQIVSVLRFVDEVLAEVQKQRTHAHRDRFLKRWRHLVALVVVARQCKRFTFSDRDLAQLNIQSLTDESVRAVWELIQRRFEGGKEVPPRSMSAAFVRRVCEHAASEFGLQGAAAVEPGVPPPSASDDFVLTEDFLDKVDRALPVQPWKPGVHRNVSAAISADPAEVYEAIQELIARGRRHHQIDGVVYDAAGKIVASDPDRVPPQAPQR
jgi:hypothetical protein